MREISTAFQTALDERQITLAVFVKAEFDDGNVLLWSGLGEVSYDGETYTGAGNLLEISAVKETVNFEAAGTAFRLTGIPSEYVSLVLSQKSRNRPVTVFLGLYTAGNWEISPVFKGRMDVMSLEYDGTTATATVTAESDIVLLRNQKNEYYTPENQKSYYPTDKGLDFVPTIEDIEITWGRTR